MSRVLIIGAGGVGSVVAHKCAQVPEVFTEILIASRTPSKCDAIAARLPRPVQTAQVDADNVPQLVKLLKKFKPDLVINVALPYQDLHIMDACLEAGVNYLDTANYEPRDVAKFEYKWQWAYHKRFEKAGLMALLGSGFDPGVTSVYTTWIRKHFIPKPETLDIIDCNAGSHGQPFATNFNPEINLREVTAKGRYFHNGRWVETDPLSVKRPFTMPDGLGDLTIYLMYHEELESIARHVHGLKRARFWMSFSDNYLTHLRVLENIGMTRIDPVDVNGTPVIPLQFLKKLLPDPASLGPLTKGKTCIGSQVTGLDVRGRRKTVFVYNVSDHAACYKEVGSQAISYTTGVPAMIGAMMMLTGKWAARASSTWSSSTPTPSWPRWSATGCPRAS
jgi:saccharopine dehydrogenase (NAD+, L-lysine forming)